MTPQERGRRMIREAGYASGGAIKDDDAEDKALVKKGIGQHENQEHGGEHSKLTLKGGGTIKGGAPPFSPGRKSRAAGGGVGDDTQGLKSGGKVKGKPGIGKVNIVIAHGGPPGGGAPPGGPPMPPHPPPMAGPPPGPPPGPPMGGPPMGAHPPMGGPPPGLGAGPMPPGPAGGPPPGMMPRPPQGIASGGRVRDGFGRFVGGAI
jgi:hypothetical protein